MQLTNSKQTSLASELYELSQKQHYKKIRKLYQRHRNNEIQDINIWNIFANANSYLNKFNDVVYCCNSIVSIDPENLQAIYNTALAYQYLSDFENAIVAYEKCISLNTEYYSAYFNCAHIYHISGDFDKSIQYYEKAFTLNNDAEILIQLGQVLTDNGNINEAINRFNQVLSFAPNHEKTLFLLAQLYYENEDYITAEKYYLKLYDSNKNNLKVVNNLGRLYEESGQLDRAISYFKEAIDIDNTVPVIHLNLGKALFKLGKTTNDSDLIQEAMNSYKKVIKLDPEQPEAYFEIGRTHSLQGNQEKAKKYYSLALNKKLPTDFEKPKEFILAAKYYLSSLEDPEIYNNDKKEFIADLFDGYAEKFDNHLVDKLEYKTPELINNTLLEFIDKDKKYNILDLGCGTGLCAPYLSAYSRELTGIDLSKKMIQKAKSLNLYTSLVVGEISEVVNQTENSYDIIVAADVFVYIGGLSDIFDACHLKMKPGSLFIFSTEKYNNNDSEEYRLYDTGRYKHSIKYIDSLINKYDFELIRHDECPLRKDSGVPVIGNLSILKKV